jgi:hypothetical protein
MARPGNFQRSSTPFRAMVMTKADFEFFAAENGFTVEVVKVKRDGWNDGRDFFVTKGGVREMVETVTKGNQPNWTEMTDHVTGRRRSPSARPA